MSDDLSLPAFPCLPAMITLLSRLSALASSALSSLPSLPAPLPSCPHNPHHRMPPSSLFSHSLRCPSTLPLSIPSPSNTSPLPSPPSPSPDSDLLLPLPPSSSPSDLLYGHCPAVVRFPASDTPAPLLLPSLLAAQCADFSSSDPIAAARLLPSELWAARSELGAWDSDRPCPISYSYAVLKAVTCLDVLRDGELKDWILRVSPRHGVVIDAGLGDRVLALLKPCLKAAWREAVRGLGEVSNGEGLRGGFECSGLCGGVAWLGSQMAVLYGEDAGRRFAVDMVKEGILRAGVAGLLIGKGEGGDGALGGGEMVVKARMPGGFFSGNILVSQVTAAVAALHERSLLERRIRELRSGHVLSRAQLLCEHLHTSAMANEERGRRIDYRPLLEHDSLIWQQSNSGDKGRPKSRVEMLAEERDYKRRRMSYRGKKVKRTPTQVLRDIIDEHMEDISRAGGIGCLVKGTTTTSEAHENSSKLCNKQTYGERSSSELTMDDPSSCMAHRKGDTSRKYSKIPCEYDKKRGHMEGTDEYHQTSSSLTYNSSRSLEEKYSRHERLGSKFYRSKDDGGRSSYTKQSSKEHRPLTDDYVSSGERHHKYHDTKLPSKERKPPDGYVRSGERYHKYHDTESSHGTFEDRYDPYGSSHISTCTSFEDRYHPSGSSDIHENEHNYSRSQCG